MDDTTYRLYYEKPARIGRYRLRILKSNYSSSETIAQTKPTEKRPTYKEMGQFIEDNGFTSYGDMKRLSDGSFVLMLRKVA